MIAIDLINRNASIGMRSFMVLGCISGLANSLVLALVNVSASLVADESTPDKSLYFLSLFAVIVTIFAVSQKRLLIRATEHVERSIHEMRKDLMGHIRHCELQAIENIGRERIFTVLNGELKTISNSSQLYVIIGQSGILMVFISAYIAWLSLTAFLFLLACILVGALNHLHRSKEIRKQLQDTFKWENKFLLRLNDTIDGFKEVKLNRARADELKDEFDQYSESVFQSKLKTQSLFSADSVWSQVSFFIGLASVVFVAPAVSSTYPDVVLKVATATLFLFGPINSFVGGIPALMVANAAAKNVLTLEEELINARMDRKSVDIYSSFNEIEIKRLSFRHQTVEGQIAFEVGPISLRIKQGQTIFITGGNGSGKTTFIRLLTGLYSANSGEIRVDGKSIALEDLDAYRNLFTSVFSDFHLFKYMYGFTSVCNDEVEEWLKLLEMEHKVSVRDKEFSTVELSGGQRKRLALMSCVLENRPIYIFDEWAADQDPYFREKFYSKILPILKERNQTVIAITHDDKYFDMADVHYKMEDGQLNEVSLS